ncbi:MAG TPA: DUF2252 domain-containing protein, partial [Thermoplasmata archaeon]|nr:DUF2252 domain-containing protein [Thermoplasmata archaeon]
GSAALMAGDLATTPVTGMRVQLCGDAHLRNFGVFATPERDEVFDVNDFDETLPGPWEWDVKRLAASLVLAAGEHGVDPRERRKTAVAAVRSYREQMGRFARQRYLDTWYAHIDLHHIPGAVRRKGRKLLGRSMAAARRHTGLYAFPRMTHVTGRGPQIADDPPFIAHPRGRSGVRWAERVFEVYRRGLPDERRGLLDRYHLVDVAQKVVGIGSVGTECAVLLLMADPDVEDPIFLQLKQASASVLEPFAGASRYADPAERVVAGQHLIQEASDIFLGRSAEGPRRYYLRQLRDMKFSPDVAAVGAKTLAGLGELCGAALARAHARSGDPARISGYLGNRPSFDEALGDFAVAYARQAERDHRRFVRGFQKGRFPSG